MERILKKAAKIFFSILLMCFLTSQTNATNIEESNHWASTVITKWKDEGLLFGRNNSSVEPDSPVTRAEFVTFVNRVFNFKDESEIEFTDVPENSWYKGSISKLATAGIVVGDNGMFHPDMFITRQEAAVILYKAFDMKANDTSIIEKFNDSEMVQWWSIDAVSALLENGYVKGRTDNVFAPSQKITRAETIVMIDNIMCELKHESGNYTEDIKKNLVINTDNVVLKDMIIPGNLYLTQGIGEGGIKLDNVTVNGEVVVRGGGEYGIVLKDSSLTGTLRVLKSNGKIKLLSEGSTRVANIEMNSGGRLKEEGLTNKGFEKIYITDKILTDHKVEFEGKFGNVFVDALSTSINVTNGLIGSLEVSENAKGTNISLNSSFVNDLCLRSQVTTTMNDVNVESLTIEEKASNSVINILENSRVKKLTAYAKTDVKGSGQVEEVIINSNNVKIERRPRKMAIAYGVTTVVAGTTVEAGDILEPSIISSGTISQPRAENNNNAPNIIVTPKLKATPAATPPQTVSLPTPTATVGIPTATYTPKITTIPIPIVSVPTPTATVGMPKATYTPKPTVTPTATPLNTVGIANPTATIGIPKPTNTSKQSAPKGIITPSPSSLNDITGFSLLNETSFSISIDKTNHTVSFKTLKGTDITRLVPVISVSPNATIGTITNVATDFTSPVEYIVTAANGTKQKWTVTCIVEQFTCPVISLIGDKVVNLYISSSYTDLGATAFDIEDGNITNDIIVSITNDVDSRTTFDTSIPATYRFCYQVKDSDNNRALEIERKVIVRNAVCITDFGARSIDEPGYEKYDSSKSIKDAIKYASENNIPTVDFGGKPGTYYAINVYLAGDITYINTNRAVLKTVDRSVVWSSVLRAKDVQNITMDGIMIYGNMVSADNPNGVEGDHTKGVGLIWFTNCKNINIYNCYLYDSWYVAIIVQKTDYAVFRDNIIRNTDCGIMTCGAASNYIEIYDNEIFGGTNQYSEPVAIYNNMSEGYSHDIVIRNNVLYNKSVASGILIENARDVIVDSNLIYDCDTGICVDNHSDESSLCYNILLINNKTRNNISQGIRVAGKDILVKDNVITDELCYGIKVIELNKKTPSERITVINNTLTNFNGNRTTENDEKAAGVIITGGVNCTIESNKFYDTREQLKNYWSIQITGDMSSDNIVENNNVMGKHIEKAPEVYIQRGKNNIINGAYDVLDQATGTIVLNNSTASTGKTEKDTKTIIASMANNAWHDVSDIIIIDQRDKVAYNKILQSWIGRQLTVKIARVDTTSIVSGGNINLKDGKSFIPTEPNASITFVFNGTKWNEVYRNPNATETLDIVSIESSFPDLYTAEELPKMVTVTLSDGSKESLPIDWVNSFPTYNKKVKGVYMHIGRPQLRKGITNSANKLATVKVIIKD